jgi:hypothetical protein
VTSVFEAGVVVSLTDKVSGGLAHMAKMLERNATAAAVLQHRMDKIGSIFKSGAIMAAGGVALATPLILATKSAMELETAMARVKTMTGASNAQMAQLSILASKTADQTGIFSKPKIMGFAAEMYSSGITDIKQISALLPGFAKAADSLYLSSNGKQGASETVHSLVALAHQFGAYTPEKMIPISEAAYAMSKRLPGGIQSLAATGASVNVTGSRTLGIDPIELMAFQAAIAQTSGSKGGGGKGRLSASNQINALQRAMPGVLGAGLISGKSGLAAATMGLADKYGASTVMKNGKFDFELYQKKIEDFEKLSTVEIAQRMMSNIGMLSKSKATDVYPLIKHALNTGGKGVAKEQLQQQLMKWQFGSADGVATMMGDKNFIVAKKQMMTAARASQREGGIDKDQRAYMGTLDGQLKRLKTTMNTLSSTVGTHMLPVMTKALTKFNDFTTKVNVFAEANPRLVQASVALLASASSILVVGGAINIVRAAFMGLQFVFPIFLRVLGPLGIAIAAVSLVIANWDKIMKVVHQNSKFLIHVASGVADACDLVSGAFKGLMKWLGNVVSQIGAYLTSIPMLAGLGSALNKQVQAMTYVDDVTAKREEAKLRARGWGGLVDGIKGPSEVQMNGTKGFLMGAVKAAKTSQTVHQTNNISMHQVPGHDHKKCADQVIREISKGGRIAMDASSGNSIGRSNRRQGSTRP